MPDHSNLNSTLSTYVSTSVGGHSVLASKSSSTSNWHTSTANATGIDMTIADRIVMLELKYIIDNYELDKFYKLRLHMIDTDGMLYTQMNADKIRRTLGAYLTKKDVPLMLQKDYNTLVAMSATMNLMLEENKYYVEYNYDDIMSLPNGGLMMHGSLGLISGAANPCIGA